MTENTYDENFSKVYDAIVTSGYYNYDVAADAIVSVLGSRNKVIELGVGTGLLAQKLIERGLNVSGFDSSRHMLKIAVKRLGSACKLYEQDVANLDLPDIYDVAVSHGGIWVGIDEGQYIDSHIIDYEKISKD